MTHEFLEELQDKCVNLGLPVVFAGDFNLIRKVEDKSSDCINFSLMNQFNDFINDNRLMEIRRGVLDILGQTNNPVLLWWS